MKGKRIVNTRAVQQVQALNDRLIARGAEPLVYPCIAISPLDDNQLLDTVLLELAAGQYDWLMLTSSNTVYALAERLNALNLTLPAVQIAAVGNSTAQVARELLQQPITYLPKLYTAEYLARTFPIKPHARICLPASTLTRPRVADILTERGASVTLVPVYTTIRGSGGVHLPELLHRQQVDAITFMSSSAVTCCLERLSIESDSIPDLNTLCIACIGPETAATAQASGLIVDVMPKEYTLSGLVEALAQFFDSIAGKSS